MPDDFLRLPTDGAGKRMQSYRRGATADDHQTQFVVPTSIVQRLMGFDATPAIRNEAQAYPPSTILSVVGTTN